MLAPGAAVILTVIGVTDDLVMVVDDAERVWRCPRADAFADARVGDVYDGKVRFKKPNPN